MSYALHMRKSTKRNIIIAIVVSVVGGGGLSAPAIADAINPVQKVTVQSFSITKTKHTLGDFKAGSDYCKVVVRHRDTGISAPIPSPSETCSLLKKGQDVAVRGANIVSGIPGLK